VTDQPSSHAITSSPRPQLLRLIVGLAPAPLQVICSFARAKRIANQPQIKRECWFGDRRAFGNPTWVFSTASADWPHRSAQRA
jgi:hypothetical protein